MMGMRALFAVAALLASGALPAATLGGRLEYPGEALPPMIVVARNAVGATLFTQTKAGQARYRLEVPAGSYVVFAIPVGVRAQPGQVPLRGAHTAYSICGRDKARLQAGRCQTGPLVELRVAADERREDVDVDDWYLPEALMATLNLAIQETAADRSPGADALFAKYPADPSPLAATKPPDFDSAPAAVKSFRSRILRAPTPGPFAPAGRVAVARWGCGSSCESWALVDMASGRITWIDDPAVQPLRFDFPCDAQPLEAREESRLLRVHRMEGGRVATQDFVWSAEAQRLEKKEQSSQTVEQFCKGRIKP